MRNASLEENMINQLTEMRKLVLHKIFMGLQKVYNSMYRDSCL